MHQNELRQAKGFDLYLATEQEGEVRTRQKYPGQVQRAVITDRSKGPYKIQAVLRSCVHGQWDSASNRPTSLIVVDYQLVTLPEGTRFSSMYTRFTFSDDGTAAPSSPEVKGFGPFKETARFNISTEGQTDSSGFVANASPEFTGSKAGNLSYNKGGERKKDRLYFDRGVGGLEYAGDQRAHAVWWNISQNRSQDNGIPINFRVAMLVERKSLAKFKATFEITAHGGLGYFKEKMIDKFVRKTDIDDDIIFDPAAEPFGNDLEDAEGNTVQVDGTQLGLLTKGQRLIGLTKVEGLSSLTANDGKGA